MLEWNPSLETGHAVVDRQHREIFAQLNEIETALHNEADHECLTRLITALMDYAYIHFHHEEHAMSCAHCPFHDANCTAHRQFILRVRSWLALIETGEVHAALLKELHAESCHWIKSHIENVDMGLRMQPDHGTSQTLSA